MTPDPSARPSSAHGLATADRENVMMTGVQAGLGSIHQNFDLVDPQSPVRTPGVAAAAATARGGGAEGVDDDAAAFLAYDDTGDADALTQPPGGLGSGLGGGAAHLSPGGLDALGGGGLLVGGVVCRGESGGLAGAVRLSEALVLYLKAMGLVRRAVELGRTVLSELPPPPVEGHGHAAATGGQWFHQVGARVTQLLQWLSNQFALLLERAEQCKLSSGAGGDGPSENATPKVEQVIYVSALQLARSAAVKELLGQHEQSLKMYQHGQLLVEALLMEPGLSDQDRQVLVGYDRGFEMRIGELAQTIAQQNSGSVSAPSRTASV